MKKFLLAAPVVMLFAACGGGAKLQPGQYEITTKITGAEIPNAPPAMLDKMKEKEEKETRCLTQAEIDNFGNKLAESGAKGASCNFSKTAFGSGTIDVQGTCSGGGNEATLTLSGTNAADSFNATMTVEGSQGGQKMKISADTNGRRVGDCPNK